MFGRKKKQSKKTKSSHAPLCAEDIEPLFAQFAGL